MATKNQHFVPRVYIKSWETQVETKKEPQKQFVGVYRFNDGDTVGDGCTREVILWKPHLYTISFRQLYLAQKCPRVYSYFTEMVYDSMVHNSPKPVYGKLGYSIIKTKKSIRKHLHEIDDWDFYYEDGTTARKQSLINRFNDMRCYLIEDSFSSIFESRWDSIKDTFIGEVKKARPLQGQHSERIISEQAAKDMMEFFFMMYCRSPQFDPMGTYSWMENLLKQTFNGMNAEVDEMMDAVWFTELYRMFFKNSGGFYHTALAKTVENCQMILFEAYPTAGSFITSDNPAFRHISVVEAQNLNGFYFPIDPKHLIFIARGEDNINRIDYRMANEELVKKFNRIIASHKTNTIIANTKYSQSFM